MAKNRITYNLDHHNLYINDTNSMIGTKINHLTLLAIEPKTTGYPKYRRFGIFKCDCGNVVSKDISGWKEGHNKSCSYKCRRKLHNEEVSNKIRNEIKYEIDGNGCRICTSHYRDSKGYARMGCGKGKSKLLHRYMYEQKYGKIGDGCLCHKCDNPQCINPEHMFIGNHSDNMLDCARKFRMHNILNREAVVEIWMSLGLRYSKYVRGLTKQLSEKYGVSTSAVWKIRGGKNYKHITKHLPSKELLLGKII